MSQCLMLRILELARSRKTVRRFSHEPVDVDKIMQAVEVAGEAPSGANYQGWRFSIILNQGIKRRIREASEKGEKAFYERVSGDWKEWLNEKKLSHSKPYLEDAPVLIVVFARNDVPYSTESVWLAIGYMLLALEELGLATVTYTPSDTKLVENVIEVPDDYRLEAILPVGRPSDDEPKQPREPVDSLVKIYR
jgi:nitroreductase